jgi:DNA-binding XRE family transcriptional regulator
MNWTGEKIRILRADLELTREDLAKMLNISASTIEKWEHKSQAKKPLKLKYFDSLNSISSGLTTKEKLLGIGGIISAPQLAIPAIGAMLGLEQLTQTKNIDKMITLLNELKNLSQEEREKFLSIMSKLS